tara:strand:- start:648 stop:3635 length:2988 start_codon:yes stop_codon:yes gene_type:complete
MTDTRGAFRLKNVRQDILNNQYVPIPSVWVTKNQAVGYTKMYGASEWKFDFTTSTTNASTHLVSSKYMQAGTSNPTHAWFVGGQPGPISDSKKITYATDTAADNPSSRFPGPRSSVGAISGETFSYFGGGIPYSLSTVSKLTHSNDTMVDLPGSHLAAGKYMMSSGHGGGAHGYFFRGMPGSGPNDNTITQRITFSNDTRSSLPSSSNMAIDSYNEVPYWGASNLQCPTHCYYGGGSNGQDGGGNSVFQKLTFSNETWALNPGYLTRNKRYISGMTANSTKGYIAGGLGPGYRYEVDYITFADDTWATEPSMELPSPIPGGQSVTYGAPATTLNDSLHPGTPGLPTFNYNWVNDAIETKKDYYYGGGTYGPWSSAAKSKYYKIEYSTDTHSAIGNSGYPRDNQGSEGTLSYSWVVGGYNYPQYWSGFSNTTKFTYSSDAIAELPGSNLTVSRANAATMGDNTKIWEAGGRDYGQSRTDFEKATFSVGTWAALPGAQLNYAGPGSTGLRCTQAGGNKTTGYMCGGGMYSPSNYSRSQKITYSSDTVALIPATGNMGSSYRLGASASSADALYIINGNPGSSANTPKMTYSTETVSVITNNIQTGTRSLNGTGNSLYGRKTNSPDDDNTSNYKIEYTTETWSTASNSLLGVRDAVMFCGESVGGSSSGTPPTPTPTPNTSDVPAPTHNGAIWMGGYSPSGVSSSGGKIAFSSDTVTELPSTYLTGNRYNLAATSSSTAGYYGQAQTTQLVKILYANDTASTLASTANLTSGPASSNDPRRRGASFGLVTAGYWTGGSTGSSGNQSVLDKTTYSSDTTARIPGSNSPYTNYASSGASNQTAGYLTGGAPNNGQYVRKLTFSSDTWSSTSSPFDNSMWDAKTMSNSTHGYFIGGEGNGNGSLVYKLTFSNDSLSQLPSSKFPFQTRYGWGTGNSTHGYASGGGASVPASKSNFYKLQYSNDTWSTISDTTSVIRNQNAAASARQNGNGDTTGVSTPNII